MEFNELKKKVTSAASAAGKKAGEITNKTKIRFALANLQSDLDELYEKLGKMHYETVVLKKGSTASEASLISKINSLRADMNILKAELMRDEKPKAVKDRICSECGKPLSDGLDFCPFCGTDIE